MYISCQLLAEGSEAPKQGAPDDPTTWLDRLAAIFRYIYSHNLGVSALLHTPLQVFIELEYCLVYYVLLLTLEYMLILLIIRSKIDQGNVVDMIILDVQKVFDTVNHSVLSTKLEVAGLGRDLLRWFTSYL